MEIMYVVGINQSVFLYLCLSISVYIYVSIYLSLSSLSTHSQTETCIRLLVCLYKCYHTCLSLYVCMCVSPQGVEVAQGSAQCSCLLSDIYSSLVQWRFGGLLSLHKLTSRVGVGWGFLHLFLYLCLCLHINSAFEVAVFGGDLCLPLNCVYRQIHRYYYDVGLLALTGVLLVEGVYSTYI